MATALLTKIMDKPMLKKRNLSYLAIAVCLILLLIGALHALPSSVPQSPGFGMISIMITKSNGEKIAYKAELATQPTQMEYGLMYRNYLPPDSAMLFLHEQPQIITMWMKNTYIPLDMIFFDDSHRIINILTNTEPESLEILSSEQPALGVIEVNAGDVVKHGIKLGDQVAYGQNKIID